MDAREKQNNKDVNNTTSPINFNFVFLEICFSVKIAQQENHCKPDNPNIPIVDKKMREKFSNVDIGAGEGEKVGSGAFIRVAIIDKIYGI
jgi:hypothetical protein